jgi:predicted phage terminase large subunit-like protein
VTVASAAARRRATLEVIEREIRWREQAATLTLGEPDPELARAHLLEFTRHGHPAYHVGWFHRELAFELERFSRDVTLGKSPRLLIAAPPRSGKSEQVSKRFPVWHLGHNPTHELIWASYSQDFVNDLSRDARSVRDEYVDWWPHLAPGNRDSVERWTIEGGGSYTAVGAGGPATGRGAHIFGIDDPFKNWEEASSPTTRESRWNWYTSTAYTRLAPGGGILVMATRWHADDMSGRMLRQLANGTEPWRVLSFPAIAEEDEPYRKRGEALHPERFDLERLEQIKVVQGSRMFAAMYQQRPTPDTGGLYQRAWCDRRYHHDPQRPPQPYTEIVASLDGTFNDAATSDFVSIQAWGRIGWTEYHLLDEVHDRMSYTGARQAARDFARKWRPNAFVVEAAAGGHALLDDLKKEVPALISFKPSEWGKKEIRAQLAAPMWEAGCVVLPNAAFTGDFVEELVSFPAGSHDDRVDAMSQVFIWWQQRRGSGGTAALNAMMAGLLGRR